MKYVTTINTNHPAWLEAKWIFEFGHYRHFYHNDEMILGLAQLLYKCDEPVRRIYYQANPPTPLPDSEDKE